MVIKLFYLYRIMGQLLPIYPVYLLMFQQKGLSLTDISWLLIIWNVPAMLLEVPSSVLADRWNRRNIMVISRLLKCCCFAIWGCWGSFAGFAAGFLVWGIAGALSSGTEEAWLYDTLKSGGRENEFDRIWGRSTFYYQITVGIVSVVGSIIASFDMQLTLWLSVAPVAISAILASLLPEQHLRSESGDFTGIKDYIRILKDGIGFCLGNTIAPILIGFNITVLVTSGVLDEYDQLIVKFMGIPLALVGLWGFCRYGLEALGSRTAWKIKHILCRFGFSDPVSMQFILAIGAFILLAATAVFPVLFMLPLYILYYFIMSAGSVLFTDALQKEIKHEGRATVQSLSAMLETPSAMLICFIFGMAGGFRQLQGALLAVAFWILLFCILLRLFVRRRA